MRIHEVTATKPQTPEQQRINALKQQKDRAASALKTERERQKKNKAQAALQQSQQVLSQIKNL